MKKTNKAITILVAVIGAAGVVLASVLKPEFLFPNRTLEVIVLDSETSKPISSALIKIDAEDQMSGSDGKAVFENLKKGYTKLEIKKEGYEIYSGIVEIDGKKNVKQTALEAYVFEKTELHVEIQNPKDLSNQASPVSLTGICRNHDKESHYWIVVNPHGTNGWWPQTREIMIKSNGHWSGSAILGGDRSQKFDIHFIIADDAAHIEFNNYLEESLKSGDYLEKPLPTGASSLSYITVTKK